jgi:hypothetical protein
LPKLRHTRNKANPLRLTLERVFSYPRQGRGRATLDRQRQTGQTTADTRPPASPIRATLQGSKKENKETKQRDRGEA